MAETTRLALPLLEAAQAQKHVTHNEALRVLDAVGVRDPLGLQDADRDAVDDVSQGSWNQHGPSCARR